MSFSVLDKIFMPRNLTEQFGEPGHNTLNGGMATIAGWGKTYTDADNEISIVNTADQQWLDMPVVSNQACADKFTELFGVDVDFSQYIR